MHTALAPNVQNPPSGNPPTLHQEPLRSMNREFQVRFTAGLLILLTTAAVVLAWINFQKERNFQIPWDGVWWAINTVTTAGSYYSPQTTAGRAITIAVLVVGVGYIAVLTGAIAQLFVRAMHAEVNAEADLGGRIDGLSAEIASLREVIHGLQL